MSSFPHVLNNTISADDNFDFRNGTALANKLLDRTFVNDAGAIYIDDKGERRIDLVVSHFKMDGNLTVWFESKMFERVDSGRHIFGSRF